MFSIVSWLRNRRRTKILATTFPVEWERILENNVGCYAPLSIEAKAHLKDLIKVFIAEKYWLACNGLKLTDEIRVTVAAEACVMILALPNDYYRNVDSIYIYPSAVIAPERQLGVFEVSTVPIRGPMPILGEAHVRGPVILVWDAAKNEARHPERGHNVVFHEFAHKLDMLDGSANGTPPLKDAKQYEQWREVCTQEYEALVSDLRRGHKTFFDPYGAINEAEFFAVISEYFFTKPQKLFVHHPRLYEVLKGFYRQDPAQK